MGLLNLLTVPVLAVFLIIVLGYYFGKIKLFNISLDLSAILIAAVIFGLLITRFDSLELNDSFNSGMAMISKLGTGMFVASIGVSTGYSASSMFKKKNLIYLLIGALMVMVGFIVMEIIYIFDFTMDKSALLGITCGALTSTPGLSAVCDMNNVSSSSAVLGYGCTYLFGVIGVVLFVQLITRKHTAAVRSKASKASNQTVSGFTGITTLIHISVAVILGYLLGDIEFSGIKFSIGNTGGILCSGIIVGYIVNKYSSVGENEAASLGVYRNLGLVLFFVGTGVPAGANFTDGFSLRWFIYGMLITVMPIIFGYFYTKIILKKSIEETVSVIAGGMTSTPAIGVLLRKNNVLPDLCAYSLTYLGALLTMVVGVYII